MPFVLDTSVAAAWLLPSEQTQESLGLRSRMAREGAWVPRLWRYEICNVLLISERRKRITREDSNHSLLALEAYLIFHDDAAVEYEIMNLARRYGLSFYDATYLELAIRKQSPLATFDRALAAAATQARVELL